ncbi:hypothetical protein SLA2020_138310 [Shorea laevis]
MNFMHVCKNINLNNYVPVAIGVGADWVRRGDSALARECSRATIVETGNGGGNAFHALAFLHTGGFGIASCFNGPHTSATGNRYNRSSGSSGTVLADSPRHYICYGSNQGAVTTIDTNTTQASLKAIELAIITELIQQN